MNPTKFQTQTPHYARTSRRADRDAYVRDALVTGRWDDPLAKLWIEIDYRDFCRHPNSHFSHSYARREQSR